ncbi:uncharacterized protein BX663DRAFT_509333 [Cokeromyces recurvatus]|uniref:uncharacterized protein n=1 Tax=Cokeromyces recurvatus TaxID=90255 RepID=UPI002221007F|nr:uncharacterized protein BX663DRAFT_509333 [Cokeromyces recurvatus]KAI7903043.1 hypothetical protein BX663DRAFT_509333 [Cokeromyces recurvatus]
MTFTNQQQRQEEEEEKDYFQEYDNQVFDTYCKQEEEEEDYVMDPNLFQLILDVQSYLTEAPKDSPLLALQYKMYTYLKQRAYE